MESKYFSTSYKEARERFIQTATKAGAVLYSLPLQVVGKDSEPLTTDIAWLGSATATKIMIHSCGVHGVEGFAGSAIQLSLLTQLASPTKDSELEIPKDCAIIFIHAVNPYGMSWWRRWNENNVDLNRNCVTDKAWPVVSAKIDPVYVQIESYINPNPDQEPWISWNLNFFGWMPYYLAVYGYNKLKSAIAGGQYKYPKGLFYGGTKCEPGIQNIFTFLCSNPTIVNANHYVHIDLHTGLGPFGVDTLMTDNSGDNVNSAEPDFLNIFRDLEKGRVVSDADPFSYKTHGSLMSGLVALFVGRSTVSTTQDPDPEFDFLKETSAQRKQRVSSTKSFNAITQEFGTLGGPNVIHALRMENFYYQRNKLASASSAPSPTSSSASTSSSTSSSSTSTIEKVDMSWYSNNVLRTFWADDKVWEEKVISRGNKVFKQSFQFLCKKN